MKTPQLKTLAVASAMLAMAVSSTWLSAQEPEAAPAEAAAEPAADAAAEPAATEEAAPAEEAAAEAPEAAPTVAAKPRPSEMLPLTSKGLMLDVVVTGKHLIAVGDRGSVIVSNNGADWATVQTPVRSPLTAVSFADEMNGWAVGHDAVILATKDGGKTWAMQNYSPELEKPFLDVIALDANNVLAFGAYGLLYKTSDAGVTWAMAEAPEIRADELHFNGAAKLNNGSVLAVGEQGMLGLSSDGGGTWTKLTSPYDGSYYGALPLGETGALVYGLRGNVYKTTDVAAGTWTKVETDTVASFFGGTNLPDGGVALVGLAGAVLKVDASDAITKLRVKVRGKDALGRELDKDVTGSFSSATPFAGGLLVVGEQGVQSLKL
ncbi:MAG: YCF48-related protein [Pseudomonadota bacterium]